MNKVIQKDHPKYTMNMMCLRNLQEDIGRI